MKQVFQHALQSVIAPKGRVLLLYGGPEGMKGDAYQPYKDQADKLAQRGCTVFSNPDDLGAEYDAVYINCPKQQSETEGLIALALSRSKGFVMAAAAKDAGGERLQKTLSAYGIPNESVSKNRCRAAWTFHAPKADRALIDKNLTHLALRPMEYDGLTWWTVPGLFGWNKIDIGSRLLLQHLPKDLSGHIADFGCGYGFLTTMLLRDYPAIEHIDAIDLDARAVTACARNNPEKTTTLWQDVCTMETSRKYHFVIMNPPFHSGKDTDMSLGARFIEKAAKSLLPGGHLYLVANRQLPYEKTIPGITLLFEGEGYKILKGGAA